MSADDENLQLEEMLARNYRLLSEPVAGQRETILAELSRAAPRIGWKRPIAWLAAAACLAALAATVALLAPSTARRVYGVEAVPGRLAEVQTVRQRGYRIIYPREEANGPPVRVPIDNMFKRPDRFRHTWTGTSYPNDAPMIVKRGTRMCDGMHESWISDSDKQCTTVPLAVLDAWIKTETWAQEFLNTMLGPPGVPCKKVGVETIGGRQCDVYEARFDRNEPFNAEIAKLWIDPATGYPVRSTRDEILPDGTTRRTQELEAIEVNIPLDDKLFELVVPEGFKVTATDVDETKLSSRYTSASYGGDKKLEFWRAFRITDRAALVVWRRSKPKIAEDGTSDWLTGVTLHVFGDDRQRTVHHDWVYQSRSPDVWNWSLVAVDGAPLPDRGGVRFRLKTKPLDATLHMSPLRFPDAGLERIIEAAASATLPDDGPKFKLEHLRTLAGQLQQRINEQ